MNQVTAKRPWLKSLGHSPAHLEYFQGSMFDKVKQVAEKYPNYTAFDFMGKATSYRRLV